MPRAARTETWNQRPRGQLRGKPEGPYETADRSPSAAVSNPELARFLDFVEQFELETERALSIKRGYSEVRLLAALMRNHLSGKLTTSSSLVGASGLSYGTTMRAIEAIEKRGLLVRRPRTPTGKSFSLHPSDKLICEWQELARRARSLVGGRIGAAPAGGEYDRDYFFGASYGDGNVLPPPSVMLTPLPIGRDLRLLVHADPTFMAMHVLKKQFESIFGVGIRSRALSIDRLRAEILDNGRAAESRYDLVACDLPWFGEMAAAGHFLPVDELIRSTGLDTSDFHAEAMASARYRGRQYGIPVQTTPELLVCRRDILRCPRFNAASHDRRDPGRGQGSPQALWCDCWHSLERRPWHAAWPLLHVRHGGVRATGPESPPDPAWLQRGVGGR